ncbi:O-antigen ligase family protein, partial [Myxococcota bacterium]|nr:O-antigen ligase family protein [Myxococcota bacterium]
VAFAVAVALGGMLVLRARTAVVALAGLGGLVAVVAHLSPHVEARLASATTDLGHRGQIWRAALAIAGDHPILGAGHGVYRVLAPRYYPEGTSRAWQIDAHDLWLHVLAETGAVGLAAFTLAVALALWALVARVRRARGTWDDRAFLDRFALLGLLAVLALGVTHFPLHHAPVALVFWALLGVADGGAWRSRSGAR